MAEALLAHELTLAKMKGIEVRSAGLSAVVGRPADSIARQLMENRKIDISSHRARQLDNELIRWSDLILTMEKTHSTVVLSMSPTTRGRIFRVGEWRDIDVPDPYQKPVEYFEHSLALISLGIDDWIPKLEG